MRQRSVAMVYQQFINYPSLTVYENIASPLRVQGRPREEIDRRVQEAAKLLRLEPYLAHAAAALSGGQQQRTAIARALVKGADLVLLDEPLANLDYKLREELRAVPRIFEASGAIFVYATTEPSEALLLGGDTVCMWEGEALQAGDTSKVYRQPGYAAGGAGVLRSAAQHRRHREEERLCNMPAASRRRPGLYAQLADGLSRRLPRPSARSGQRHRWPPCVPRHRDGDRDHRFESFVHLNRDASNWVAVLQGVHEYEPGHVLDAVLDPDNVFVFDAADRTVAAPFIYEEMRRWPALTSSISRTPTAAMTRRWNHLR